MKPQPSLQSSPQTQQGSAKERLQKAVLSLRGMDRVEALISTKLVSEAPLLQEIGTYLLQLGGKRMRPLLTLLVAKLCGDSVPKQEVIDVASGIELIHMATLLHDDIIDKSPLRRHKQSSFIKYGMENSLLTGDFLLTRAFSLCAHLDTYIIEATERACIHLTEGEILETSLVTTKHDQQSSLEIARKKTASLFKLAALSGSHLCEVPLEVREQCGVFGEKLGIAFQILDDILDVASDEAHLGKKAGTDIHERKPSMINVLWLESGSALSRRLVEQPSNDDDQYVVQALAELRESVVLSDAKRLAQQYVEEARQALLFVERSLPSIDREALDGLTALMDYTLERME